MEKERLTIRLYKKGDERGIIELFKKIFGREMTHEEWQWKYTGRGETKIYSSVAVHSEMWIVGHYGGLCHPIIYRGNPARCLAICDVMIHPRFRGIGTLKKLSYLVPHEAVKDGIIMGYGFPNRDTLLRPAMSLRIYENVEDVLEGNKEVVSHNDAVRYMLNLFPLDYSDFRIEHLWELCKTQLSLAVVRDRNYLTWRYKHHPFFRYELWGLRKRFGRKLLGLAVLRGEGEKVFLIDFLSLAGMLAPLLKQVENSIHSSGGKTLTLWFPPFMEKRISALSFSTVRSCTSIPRTTHENTLTKSEMEGQFFYTMGDTDFM